MPDAERITLALYRMEKAEQCLHTARNAMDDGDYAASANRSYYAVFHAIRALFALEGIDFKKHSAVISKFRELYIKTKRFPVEFSELVGSAFELRTDSDYEDFYVVEKSEVEEQLYNAGKFLLAVREDLQNII